MPVASATVIEIGDTIHLVSGLAVNAAGLAKETDDTAARETAADTIIGMARTASANGETDPVVVDISLEAIYELDLQSAGALSFGDLVEIFASLSYVVDQQFVAGSTSPVAVCVKEKPATGTKFLAKLVPQKLLNTPQD